MDPDDDMFAEDFQDAAKPSTAPLALGEGRTVVPAVDGGVDDDDGYYSFRVGEYLKEKRYEVLGYFGKGVYSNVIRARDARSTNLTTLKQGPSILAKTGAGAQQEMAKSEESSMPGSEQVLAIKLLRNNAHMKRSGKKEVKILKRLDEADVEGKCFCMKLYDSFEERNHMCLVFEAMDMNLTEVIKMYGHKVGLNIKAVRSYAFKMFKALALLKSCNVIHADIKPDNILVSKDRNTVKLADFGTAFESQEYEVTNQLVSRFYRAPEIILGLLPPTFAIDTFSLGCTLYELATGSYLLPSKDDNHHVKLIMDLSGPVPKKLFASCHPPFLLPHFDIASSPDPLFLERYPDPLDPSRSLVRKLALPQKPSRDLAAELLSSYSSAASSPLLHTEIQWVHRLADLILQCLTIDPKKRISPEQALQHAFF